MSQLWLDLEHALRLFRKRPLFTLIVLVTLGLGIGANAAMFSVVNGLLLQPLPVPDSERLVFLGALAKDGRRDYISYPDFEDLQAEARLFAGFTAFVPQSVNLTGRPEPARVQGGFVSDTFFEVVGVVPSVGRGFRAGEDKEGAEPVCVVAHETWQTLYGGDPHLLGGTLMLNNQPFVVVGIMSPGFRFPYDVLVDVWIPHHYWPVFGVNHRNRAAPLVSPIARLRPGVAIEAARTEVQTIAARLAREYPEAGKGRSISVRPLRDVLVEETRSAVLVLMASVVLLLLVACANVANLMLSLGTSRVRELSTRAALGASQLRLVRQLLVETLLLWTIGAALGIVLGHWLLDALLALAPRALPTFAGLRLDGTVLAYTALLAVITGLVFGLLPALRFSRPDLIEGLKDGGRTAGEGRGQLRSALVVAELALTLVLLAASGLFLESFSRLLRVDVGFQPEGLLTLEYRLPRNKYAEGSQQLEFHRQVLERVRAIPGVRAATQVMALPFSGNAGSVDFELPDRASTTAGEKLQAQINQIADGYFTTLGVPLLRGRVFEDRDHAQAPSVVVVNRALAERFWPGNDPLGRPLRVLGEDERVATVVGVVGDVKHGSLDEAASAQIYLPQSQRPHIFNTLVVRAEGDPLRLAPAVRSAVWSVDKDQPVWKVRTEESLIERSLGMPRFLVRLMGGYSALALLLAAVGLYGVMSYAVARRVQEIGVRVALGARPRDVLRLVLARSLRLTALGAVIGLAAALALGQVLQGLLFEVPPNDPSTLGGVLLVLTMVSLAASAGPAWRATRVDALVALRHD
jgi:putative ABC transport system permease protein